MDQEDIDKVVLAYLDQKGFKLAGLAFQQEKQQHSKEWMVLLSTKKVIASFARGLIVHWINISMSWLESCIRYLSMDLWILLQRVIFRKLELFFNSFRGDNEVTHSRDLQKLEGVLSPSHLEEMEFAHRLRQSKVNINICQYSYDLLLQYLHKPQSITMLGVINEHINFLVSPGQPASIADDAEYVTLFGRDQDAANLINQKEIHWGLLEDSLEEKLEKMGVSNLDSEKVD